MMIPTLVSSSERDSSAARVQPKPYLMPPLQFDDNDTTINNNDNDTMSHPSTSNSNNAGGVEGNDDGFTTPVMHHHDCIIRIRKPTLLPEFPVLILPNANYDRSSTSSSKHNMISLKPRIRRRSISIEEKRTLLARSA